MAFSGNGSEAFESADDEVFSVYVRWVVFQNEKGSVQIQLDVLESWVFFKICRAFFQNI